MMADMCAGLLLELRQLPEHSSPTKFLPLTPPPVFF